MTLFRNIFSKRLLFIRYMSSKQRVVDFSVDREGIAVISMNRLPLNSLNLELLQQVTNAVDLAQKKQCNGLVLTSSTRIFSAGIDFSEIYKPDVNRLRSFWSAFQDLFLKLYGSGETTSAAAINGFTTAGGCLLTLLCDYRVMVSDSKSRIGLSETSMGMVPRPWMIDIATQVMGIRQAEIALTASYMYTVEEALKVNLIDETASDREDAIEKCKQFIRMYKNIPANIKAKTKICLREKTIRLVAENREEDLKQFTETIISPCVQELIASIRYNGK